MANLVEGRVISSGTIKVYGAAGQGDALYLNEHLKFVSENQLTSDDVWEIVEVEDGNVLFRCPTRGFLVIGIQKNNVYWPGYHQFERTASRFKVESGHLGSGEGYKSYRWVSNNPAHNNHFFGIWNDSFVVRGGTGEATSLKIAPKTARLRVYGAAGQGDSIYLTEHLNFRSPNELSPDDEWQIIPVEGGDVVFKCPTRGFLLAGIQSDGGYLLGYHQFEQTASRFTPVPGHLGSNEGYTSYQWKNNRSFYLGIWRDLLRLRNGAGDATSWKQE